MAGFEVNRQTLNMKVGNTALQVREVFEKVETIFAFLGNHPTPEGGSDPLVEDFGFNADEAYAIRLYFESLNNFRINNANVFASGRTLTGLE